MRIISPICYLSSAFIITLSNSATTTEHIGSLSNWTNDWKPISGINDGDNGVAEEIDFVGDSNDWGGYYDITDEFVFFRMRLDIDAVVDGSFHDAHLVLIDLPGVGDDFRPDYSFAWDSKSTDPSKHGFEMQVLSTTGPAWKDITMDDLDGSNGQKLTNDINGGGRTSDGYVRSIDGQATTNFGATTFLDFAVSWTYLEKYTIINPDQNWNIQFASIANATDHNALNGDIAGNQETTTIISASSWIAVPEPRSALILGFFASALAVTRRRP